MFLCMKPHALTRVCMHAGDGVDESSSVVDDQVGEAVVCEGVVSLPFVGEDDSPRSNVLLDKTKKSVVIPSVICALHQEAFSCSPAVSSHNPLPDYSSSNVILPLPELGLVDLHDVPPSSNLPRCSVLQDVLHHTLSDSFVEGPHCLLVHRQDSSCISDAGTIDEYPKKVEVVDKGDAAFVEDASCSDREVVLITRTGPAITIAVLGSRAGSQIHVGAALQAVVVRT